MAKKPRSKADLTEDMWQRFDPDGSLRKNVHTFRAFTSNPIGRTVLRLAGTNTRQVAELVDGPDALILDMAKSITLLGPWGWVPSFNDPVEIYRHAIRMFETGHSQDEIEQLIEDYWNEGNRLRLWTSKVKAFGVGHDETRELFQARARLVDKAYKFHQSGEYEAAFFLAISQADGIAFDALGGRITKGLFDSGAESREGFLDALTIAGMPESLQLSVMQFRENLTKTQNQGSLSRHGAFHGRELGYGTRRNSTKALVALIAVIEWAEPRIKQMTAQRIEERFLEFAGVKGLDSRGRRLDRRGFNDAVKGLENLHLRQLREMHNRGRFGASLEVMFPRESSPEDFLCGRDAITMVVSEAGDAFYAFRQSEAGTYFGIADAKGKLKRRDFVEDTPPSGGPDEDDRWAMTSTDWAW